MEEVLSIMKMGINILESLRKELKLEKEDMSIPVGLSTRATLIKAILKVQDAWNGQTVIGMKGDSKIII